MNADDCEGEAVIGKSKLRLISDNAALVDDDAECDVEVSELKPTVRGMKFTRTYDTNAQSLNRYRFLSAR